METSVSDLLHGISMDTAVLRDLRKDTREDWLIAYGDIDAIKKRHFFIQNT